MSLPTDAKARKHIPLYRGLFCYFPDALAAVAELSMIGNDQHNPGEPLHWAREKSTDEEDAQLRHMLDKASGKPMDTDKVRHATKAAWRALAGLQKEIEAEVKTGETGPTVTISSKGVCVIASCPNFLGPLANCPKEPVRVETHIPAREDREPTEYPRCNLLLYTDTAGNHFCSKARDHGGQCSR